MTNLVQKKNETNQKINYDTRSRQTNANHGETI